MAFPLHRRMLIDAARQQGAWIRFFLQLWVWIVGLDCARPVDAADSNTSGVLAFDLLPVLAGSPVVGALDVELGSPAQSLDLLATFYTHTDASLQVPIAALCAPGNGTETGAWNTIQEPAAGDVLKAVPTATTLGNSAGMEVVRWTVSLGPSNVNLGLRAGKGADTVNLTVIATDIPNSGEYPWNVTQTFVEAGLQPRSDYSLMLWTDSPPRRAVSNYFTITDSKNAPTSDDAAASTNPDSSDVTAQQLADMTACLAYLNAHGGVYNQTQDASFRLKNAFDAADSDANTSWAISTLGAGSLSVGWPVQNSSGITATYNFSDVDADLISSSTLGMGTVGLSNIQATRNAPDANTNFVALHLGTEDLRGTAVLGGYDSNLIHPLSRATFERQDSNSSSTFVVTMSELYIVADKSTKIFSDSQDSSPQLTLAYDAPGIRLPRSMLDEILPYLGSPTFDEGLGGYLYDQGADTLDSSLSITLSNGSSSIVVSVPASSLLANETVDDNPLTARNETGRTYLQLSPTPDGGTDGAYLGRAFLQHVYLINAPSSITRFHVAALPPNLPTSKKLVAGGISQLYLFTMDGDKKDSQTSSKHIGAVAGGVVGGIFVLFVVGLLVAIFCFKKRIQRIDGKWVLTKRRLDGQRAAGSFSFDRSFDKDAKQIEAASLSPISPGKDYSFHTAASIPVKNETASSLDVPLAYARSQLSVPQAHAQHRGAAGLQYPEQAARTRMSSDSAIDRRKSEVSTVARDVRVESSVMGDVLFPEEPVKVQRSATVGRVFSGEMVRRVDSWTPPHTPGRAKTFSHARTASLGRVCTPTSIEFENGVVVGGSVKSRRSSTTKSTSQYETPPQQASLGSLADVLEESKRRELDDAGRDLERQKRSREHWRMHRKSSRSNGSIDTDVSSIFGLEAVTQDGEYVDMKGADGFLDSDSTDSSRGITRDGRYR